MFIPPIRSRPSPLRVHLRFRLRASAASASRFLKCAPRAALLVSLCLLGAGAGCVLAPEGLDAEAERAAAAGEPYRAPLEERTPPELPADPEWDDYVRRALAVHGDVEAAWAEWTAAVERVRVAAGWPNTNLAVDFSTALGSGGSLWERSTVGLGFDPMEMLALPAKTRAAGRVALEEARAAGSRFDAARLAVRRRTIEALAARGLWAERQAASIELVGLLSLAESSARAGLAVGAAQQELLQLTLESGRALAEQAAIEAQGPGSAAALNALLGRPPEAELAPIALEDPGPLPDDGALLALGATDGPGLVERAALVAARREAVGAAELRWWPDVAPTASASGGADEELGAMVSIPITWPAVSAAIAASRAELAAAQAVARQADRDANAVFVGTLAALRAAERQVQVLEESVAPAAEQLVMNGQEAYASGASGLEALIEGRRAALEARVALAEARAARRVRLAELEELAGGELERNEAELEVSR